MQLDTIVCGDCLDVMAEMPDGCVDVVITDPPFGKNTKEWDIEPTAEMWQEIRRVGNDFFAIFGYPANLMNWNKYFSDLKLIGYIVWVKYNELVPSPGLTRAHQDIAIWGKSQMQLRAGEVRDAYRLANHLEKFFCEPGVGTGSLSQRLRDAGTQLDRRRGRRCTDVWAIPAPGHGFNSHLRNHRNEKPQLALERLIKLLTEQGDLAFDPFIGSGTTAVAALKLGRHFYGYDISQSYVDIANERIEKARLEMSQLEMAL